MASSDVVIAAPAVATVPQDYVVPASQEIVPLVVTASIDGSGAGGQFLPTVEILSPAGQVIARCPTQSIVAAGGSADVSWFHIGLPEIPSAALSPYQTVVLTTPDVRSYWPLDELSGTQFADLGPSNKPLVITGTATMGQPPLILTGQSAIWSGAVDGAGFAVDFAKTGTYGLWPAGNSLSVEGWLKTAFVPTAPAMLLCGDNGASRLFQFRIETSGKLGFLTFGAGGSVNPEAVSSGVVNDGARRHLVATFDGTTFEQNIYVNGVLDTTTAGLDSNQPILQHVDMAARVTLSNQNPCGGDFDEFALYSRALTAAEVAAHYAAGI